MSQRKGPLSKEAAATSSRGTRSATLCADSTLVLGADREQEACTELLVEVGQPHASLQPLLKGLARTAAPAASTG